jgi:hypothetical protein
MNLISLCRVCHGRTHWAIPYWQERFTAKLKARLDPPRSQQPARQ